jgi:adenylylsulfate kinase-like enzyme|tara:strand:+ start:585 stop:1097 length:513 start_codon:yes stop_codon:yes gene_type:complete
MQTFSIWIIGPSAVGKTTVSKIFYNQLKIKNDKLILIDGDQIRSLYENNLGYDPISRSKNTHRYINLVKWLTKHEISSIVAVISPFEKDREFCRKEIKNYKQIYLNCSLDERIKRDKKKLYAPALKGEKKHVVDVDIPFDLPKKSELSIDTEKKRPGSIVEEIIKKLKLL